MSSTPGHQLRLTRQTWLALTSAISFVTLALLIALLPVPFVIYSPGRAYDVFATDATRGPLISVQGVTTYPTNGQIHMTTVAVTKSDARTSLPEAVIAYWLPKRDALPRDSVYNPGKSSAQVQAEERLMMDTAQQDAVVAALRATQQPVEEHPVVTTVVVSGPAHERLQPGDLILAVGDTPTHNTAEVREAIRRHAVGEEVRLKIERNRRPEEVAVTTVASNRDPQLPVIGIEIGIGYRYTPVVTFGIRREIGGPSAGLVFALALADKLNEEDLVRGRTIAGTGGIDPLGRVSPIGGLQEKIASAERVGATIFLVPAGNCRDLVGLDTRMELIRVATLDDAINALRHIDQPEYAAQIPRC